MLARIVPVTSEPLSTDTPPPIGLISDGSLLAALQSGQADAADALFHRYAERIRALARMKLSRGLACRLDADDIVQSVFRRFFHAAQSGRYQLPTGQELWDLLLVITLNRLRSAELHHRAGKRDLRQTVSSAALEIEDSDSTREEASEVLLTMVVDEALEKLSDRYREVVRLRMDGHEVAEIAGLTGRSKRTVERLLQEAKLKLRSLLKLEC